MRAGVDEVGMGCVAGSLFVCAVAIDPGVVPGVKDSKQLSEAQRIGLCTGILQHAAGVAFAERSAAEIDAKGLARCWAEAVAECAALIREAVPGLEAVVADDCPHVRSFPGWRGFDGIQFIPGGDDNVYEIGAASIVAKVTRDGLMDQLDLSFPGYGLAKHSGYGTRDHAAALIRLGPSPIHRATWQKLVRSWRARIEA